MDAEVSTCIINRIYIGDEYDRWMEIKTAVRLETNSEVVKILLDR
jgi:hypothetical protein